MFRAYEAVRTWQKTHRLTQRKFLGHNFPRLAVERNENGNFEANFSAKQARPTRLDYFSFRSLCRILLLFRPARTRDGSSLVLSARRFGDRLNFRPRVISRDIGDFVRANFTDKRDKGWKTFLRGQRVRPPIIRSLSSRRRTEMPGRESAVDLRAVPTFSGPSRKWTFQRSNRKCLFIAGACTRPPDSAERRERKRTERVVRALNRSGRTNGLARTRRFFGQTFSRAINISAPMFAPSASGGKPSGETRFVAICAASRWRGYKI